jgi:hypothetical protein
LAGAGHRDMIKPDGEAFLQIKAILDRYATAA